MAKEPNSAKPVTSEVTPKAAISEAHAEETSKLSAKTLAEQEAGRQSLKAYQDTIKSR